MSADWKVGDRAICVDNTPHFPVDGSPLKGPGVICGHIYIVEELDHDEFGLWLGFPGDDDFWHSESFRKLVPACDRVTQEQHATP